MNMTTNTNQRINQEEEALIRLKLLGLYDPVIEGYEADRTVYYSEPTPIGGILYWLSNEPEWEKKVREAEEKNGFRVYHVTHEHHRILGEMLTCLYVSKYAEEWDQEKADLSPDESGLIRTIAHVIPLSHPEFAESGYVGMREAAGGLIRTM